MASFARLPDRKSSGLRFRRKAKTPGCTWGLWLQNACRSSENQEAWRGISCGVEGGPSIFHSSVSPGSTRSGYRDELVPEYLNRCKNSQTEQASAHTHHAPYVVGAFLVGARRRALPQIGNLRYNTTADFIFPVRKTTCFMGLNGLVYYCIGSLIQ